MPLFYLKLRNAPEPCYDHFMDPDFAKIEGVVKNAILSNCVGAGILEIKLDKGVLKENNIPTSKPIFIRGFHRIDIGEKIRIYYNREMMFASNQLDVLAYEILDKNKEVVFRYK